MTVKKETPCSSRSRDELIEDVLFKNMFECFDNNDKENALHYLYALKMWRKI